MLAETHIPSDNELSFLYETVRTAYRHPTPTTPNDHQPYTNTQPNTMRVTGLPLQDNDFNNMQTTMTATPPPIQVTAPQPTRRYRPLPPIPGSGQTIGVPPSLIPPYLPHTISRPPSTVNIAPTPVDAPRTPTRPVFNEETLPIDRPQALPDGARPPMIPGPGHINELQFSDPESTFIPPYQRSPPPEDRSLVYVPHKYTPLAPQQTGPSPAESYQIPVWDMPGGSSYRMPATNGSRPYSPPRLRHINSDMRAGSISTDSAFFEPGPSGLSESYEPDIDNILIHVGRFPNDPPLDYEDDHSEIISDDTNDPLQFVNWALLSHIAVRLRDKVPRGTHVKGSIPYPRAFTGKDIVSTIQYQIQRELVVNLGGSGGDRRAALQVARSLQSQLFFYEVEWNSHTLQDGVEDVYMFMDDQEGDDAPIEREELPTGVVTYLTKCYSPDCGGASCYSYGCPRKMNSLLLQLPDPFESSPGPSKESWSDRVPVEIIRSLPQYEIKRQTIIHTLISKEEQYIRDLDLVETVFIKPLKKANPPVISHLDLEEFLDEVFGNILDLRECNRRLLEVLYVRQREQGPVIERIGDVFLDAATEFRIAYPKYVGHHPIAERRVKEEVERNPDFRLFIERCSRQRSPRSIEGSRMLDLRHYLNRPAEHLQKYPVLLEAILHETHKSNPDRDFLQEATAAIKNLQQVAQLRTFQSAMGKGFTGKWEWNDLVSREMIKGLTKEEIKRQSVIFELIKGEMAYVRDLEVIETLFVQHLRGAEPPIIENDRLDKFIQDVFCNFLELHAHHRRLLDKLHEIQREEHPRIRSITAALFDAALNFREAYMEYIPNYPIAAYRIDDEMVRNHRFRRFVDTCARHPDAGRLDLKNFINRPIPRLLRYELLLKSILDETPPMHEDREAVPQVIEVIKALGRETEPGVQSARQKVDLWSYNSSLVFKPGEYIDMDLLNEQRSLLHAAKLLRQPEGSLTTWTELFVLLFDNYLVMTKTREKDGMVKHHVTKRPIPLDLLALYNFSDSPQQRVTGILRNLRGGGATTEVAVPTSEREGTGSESRVVYPMTLIHTGRMGSTLMLYADSAAVREEWRQKLEEALGLRKVVQESNKVFEIDTLSADTFFMPPAIMGQPQNLIQSFTGKVTCSVPFTTPDGRILVAIGCTEGVWMGFRRDPRSMQRVLHIKKVTQCEMLDDFGVFLVLADKTLFAYHIEALVPTNLDSSQQLHKMNAVVHKEVQFFRSGKLNGRTLVVFAKKDGSNTHFYAVEPVFDKINDRSRPPSGIASRLLGSKTNWFRDYRKFVHTCEAYDVVFLKAKLGVLCSRGFEILDSSDFESSVNIPVTDDPRSSYIAKRCASCRPIGMFRSAENEFLLCYDEFGVYVNKRGVPNRLSTGTIEWEGKADRVALHPPYILLFDPHFIEIRHIKTGRLVQIIQGSGDVRCLWNSLGPDSSAAIIPSGGTEEHMVQEPRVHAAMSIQDTGIHPNGRPKPVSQHIFELTPTIPLYLPGSLASPSTATYFPQSYSPPHSPPLRANHSLRG